MADGNRISMAKRTPRRALTVTFVVAMATLITGCVGAVTLRHPGTGRTVTCGPYALKFGVGGDQLNRCLDDYQRQGYERVPD